MLVDGGTSTGGHGGTDHLAKCFVETVSGQDEHLNAHTFAKTVECNVSVLLFGRLYFVHEGYMNPFVPSRQLRDVHTRMRIHEFLPEKRSSSRGRRYQPRKTTRSRADWLVHTTPRDYQSAQFVGAGA